LPEKKEAIMLDQTGRKYLETRSALRKRAVRFVAGLIAMIAFSGCASTKVSREPVVTGKLPRPANILVYDFAATPEDLPAYSSMSGQYAKHSTPQTAEQIALGRQLGDEIARELVELIHCMGMPAVHAAAGTTPQINDIVLQGYIIVFEEGSAAKRVGIGLGAGSSELNVAVEGFQMTNQGLRKLGGGTTEAGGGKMPGGAVGAAAWLATASPAGLIVSTGMKVYGEKSGSAKIEGRAKQTAEEIAKVLKTRFQEQGWIK
jgi:hypothetical protein